MAYLNMDNRLENLSLIKTKIGPEFSMEKNLGTPQEAATYLLDNVIAPQGSGKVYSLLNVYERVQHNQQYYVFEYTLRITNTDFFQHTLIECGGSPQRGSLYLYFHSSRGKI